MNRSRNRTLTFRVTQEEFDRLQVAAIQSGASCLSEFIRQAALQTMDPDSTTPNGWLVQQIQGVHERMNRLESKFTEIFIAPQVQLVKAASE